MLNRSHQLETMYATAEAALRERRYADADAVIAAAGEIDDAFRDDLVRLLADGESLRGATAPPPALVDELAAAPMFDLRPWSEVLDEARKAAGLRHADLVADLADRFGVTEPLAVEHLEERYHELETGQLDPSRVRPALVDALGEILGGWRETLRATRFNPLPDLGPQAVMARSQSAPEMVERMLLADAPPPAEQPPSAEQRRIDDLFGVDA